MEKIKTKIYEFPTIMKKHLKKILFLLITIILSAFLYIIFTFLWWSENLVEKRILFNIPLGTEMSEVESYINRQGWKINYINKKYGYHDQRKYSDSEKYECRNGGSGILKSGECVVGNKSIRVSLGNYGLIFITNVTVLFGFDDNEKLINIWIWKTTDSL